MTNNNNNPLTLLKIIFWSKRDLFGSIKVEFYVVEFLYTLKLTSVVFISY